MCYHYIDRILGLAVLEIRRACMCNLHNTM
jgi:hypothetical protein